MANVPSLPDSKSQILKPVKTELTFNDAYELISKKILVNRMSVECLKSQIAYSHAVAKLQLLNVKVSRQKLELVEKLNKLLEPQLKEFDDLRQDECMELYHQLNELDQPSDDWKKICDEAEKHQKEMMTLVPRIRSIESTIPPQLMITNFRIKRKVEPAHNCATEIATINNSVEKNQKNDEYDDLPDLK